MYHRHHLQRAIGYLPAGGPARVYRGINKKVPPGIYKGVVTWQAFSSTTYTPAAVAAFSGLDRSTREINGTLFVIDVKGTRCAHGPASRPVAGRLCKDTIFPSTGSGPAV